MYTIHLAQQSTRMKTIYNFKIQTIQSRYSAYQEYLFILNSNKSLRLKRI